MPFDAQLAKKKKYKKWRRTPKFRQTFPLLQQLTSEELWENFNALCRGEQVRPTDGGFNVSMTSREARVALFHSLNLVP